MTCITNKNSESGSWAQKEKKKVQNTVLLENTITKKMKVNGAVKFYILA